MAKKRKTKRRLSPATRARLARQARINFGHIKKRKKGVIQVARRRRKTATRKTARRRTTGSKKMKMGMLLGAGVYGAVRQFASDALAPFTSKIPLGTIGDEVALAFLGNQLKRRTSGVMSDVGNAAMIVEMARIGVAVADRSAFAAQSSSSGVGSDLQPNTFVG